MTVLVTVVPARAVTQTPTPMYTTPWAARAFVEVHVTVLVDAVDTHLKPAGTASAPWSLRPVGNTSVTVKVPDVAVLAWFVTAMRYALGAPARNAGEASIWIFRLFVDVVGLFTVRFCAGVEVEPL